jgi:hypothetical protein
MDPPFDITENYTHETHYREADSHASISFYRVINYIFTTSLLGVICYAIDSFADICNQNSDGTFQGSFMIDHNVISLEIDLELLCHGKLASLKESFRPPHVVLPKARS